MPFAQKILSDTYRDSVALMRLSATLSEHPEIRQASAVMATEANMQLLLEAGLLQEPVEAAPGNLMIAIEAVDDNAVATAFEQAEALLNSGPQPAASDGNETGAPHSLEMALDDFPDADLALISCPGEYAGAEAMKALRLGLDVMIFSDNVPLDEEMALKRLAGEQGKLVMGPDCGTAIINCVPLGFANAVAPGDIGIVAASGTGLQQVACLIDGLGGGISQAIGTGGRDLHAEIGGISMLNGLDILTDDAATSVIVLISKPPALEVAAKIRAEAKRCGKPVVVNFLGAEAGLHNDDNLFAAETLEQAAFAAFDLSRGDDPSIRKLQRHPLDGDAIDELRSSLESSQKFARCLYSGGTFSYEAMLLLDKDIAAIHSPSPLDPKFKLNDVWSSTGNTVLDLGDDHFTRGRPHPMIDQGLRLERLRQEANDPETAVILLDVVIGHGAHDSPADELAKSIAEVRASAKERGYCPLFIAFVCGTDKDPQNRTKQSEILRHAGVVLTDSNAQAARLVCDLLSGR